MGIRSPDSGCNRRSEIELVPRGENSNYSWIGAPNRTTDPGVRPFISELYFMTDPDSEKDKQTPGIRLIPPLVYAVPLLIGLGVEQLLPSVTLSGSWRIGPGAILIGLSSFLVVPAVMHFKKANTPFDVRKPATTLITDGPYRYTRNPGYLALTLLYLGLGFLFSSVYVIALIIPVLWVMNVAVVRKEEDHLDVQFGEEYLRFKSSVRRWL